MAKIIKSKGLAGFTQDISSMLKGVLGLSSINGKVLVHEGEFIEKNIDIKINRLSDSNEEAVEEADYVGDRVSGKKLTNNKVKRTIRDLLENHSEGLM